MRSSTLVITAALLAVGPVACVPASIEAPRCPNPVLLGPIDRVGGHRAGREVSLGKVRGEAFLTGGITSREGVRGALAVPAPGAVELSAKILETTGGRAERDVRVDRIVAGSNVVFFGGVLANRWVSVKGHVVEVAHAK
jgi:hypothetical protein